MPHKIRIMRVLFISLVLGLAACASTPENPPAPSGRLEIVATTTIVADVVRSVGGEAVHVTSLLPEGTDPHSFQPTPQDVAKVAEADLIIAHGAGLEEFLEPLLENANGAAEVIYAAEGIELHEAEAGHAGADENHAGEGDPHTWFDPNNVIVWTQNIEEKLVEYDPSHAASYAENSRQYQAQLADLDAWIRDQVAQIPEANRLLVTDHALLTYFAERYGFEQIGTVIPGYSTLASPSAQEMAALEDVMREVSVRAVFAGTTVNPNLPQQIAKDMGIQLIFLYTGSLTGPDGDAPTYIDMMRYNVRTMVEVLK